MLRAKIFGRVGCLVAILANLAMTAPAVRAADTIGIVATAENKVTGTLASDRRLLKISSDVFRDEEIETFAKASAQLLFLDETSLTLGPNSQVVLDEMIYEPQGGAGSMALKVVKGAARFVSGIQKSEAYVIRTPTSNIGIRGTALGIIVGAAGQTIVILLEGLAIVQDLLGRVQTLNIPGTFTIVGGSNKPPSPPAPAPPSIFNQLGNSQSIGNIIDILLQLPPNNLPVDLQDFVNQEPAGGGGGGGGGNNQNYDPDDW